jgi:hypothetical protein
MRNVLGLAVLVSLEALSLVALSAAFFALFVWGGIISGSF